MDWFYLMLADGFEAIWLSSMIRALKKMKFMELMAN